MISILDRFGVTIFFKNISPAAAVVRHMAYAGDHPVIISAWFNRSAKLQMLLKRCLVIIKQPKKPPFRFDAPPILKMPEANCISSSSGTGRYPRRRST
jgi:hypothetical protein